MNKEQREEAFRRNNPEVGLLSNGRMYRVIDGEYEPVMDSEVEASDLRAFCDALEVEMGAWVSED